MSSHPTRESAFSSTVGQINPSNLAELRNTSPQVASVLDKLVAPRAQSNTRRQDLNKTPITAPDVGMLQQISDHTTTSISDSDAMLEMLPDLERAALILVSLILSPKDFYRSELTYSVENSLFNHEASGAMIDVIRTHFDNDYRISELLPKMIEEALVTKGSFPLLILPETSIDRAINSPNRVTLESIQANFTEEGPVSKTIGLLGAPTETAPRTGMESLHGLFASTENYQSEVYADPKEKKVDLNIRVYDNPEILKFPSLLEKARQDQIHSRLNQAKIGGLLKPKTARVSMESGQIGQPEELSLYRRRTYRAQQVVAMAPGSHFERQPVGHPLVIQAPAEAVIPVHTPGSPDNHLAYFIVLDETGHPIRRVAELDYYRELSSAMRANTNMSSALLQSTNRQTNGLNPDNINTQHAIELERIYSELLERDLLYRLNNGLYGKNVEIANSPEISRVMLSRSLANQMTQILFLPAEMVTYVAFEYNKYGVGRSLLSKSRIIGSIRSMLMFANTMAAIKNSVGRTQITITPDPRDPQPAQSVNFLMHEYAKNRQGTFPLAVANPADLITFLQNAAVEVSVNGTPGYPETKFEIEDSASNKNKPDPELEKSMRDRQILSMGLAPEMVDSSMSPEFATTITQNNALTTKMVVMWQGTACSHLEDFIQKYTLSSGPLIDELRQVLQNHRSDSEANEARIENEKAEREAAATPDTTDTDTVTPSDETPAEGEASEGDETPTDPDVDPAPATESYHVEMDRISRTSETIDKALSKDTPSTAKKSDKEGPKNVASLMGTEGEDDDSLIFQFIQSIRVSLPEPDTTALSKQMEAFKEYVEHLDAVLPAYINAEFLKSNELGAVEEHFETVLASIKAYYMRRWLRENNVMPELEDLLQADKDKNALIDLLEINGTHAEGLRRSIGPYLERVLRDRKHDDDAAQAIVDGAGVDVTGGGGGGDSWDTGGGDTGGADDFPVDPPEEPEVEEEEPAEETPDSTETPPTEEQEQEEEDPEPDHAD